MTDPDDHDLDAGLEPCPDCEGTGVDPFDGDSCQWCLGAGVVDT